MILASGKRPVNIKQGKGGIVETYDNEHDDDHLKYVEIEQMSGGKRLIVPAFEGSG